MERVYEVGDIVMVRENSLHVTEDTLAYIFHTYAKVSSTFPGDYWAHIVTEKDEIIYGITPEEQKKGFIFLAKSPYLYRHKEHGSSSSRPYIQQWVDTEIFKSIIASLSSEDEGIVKNIIGRRSEFWAIKNKLW